MPPRLARLLAVVVAVALVGIALVVRGAIADDEDAGTDAVRAGVGDPGDGPGGGGDGGTYRVLCDADLGAACDALAEVPGVDELTVMTGGEALAAFAREPVPFDAWFTLDPMPEVLDAARRAQGEQEVAGDDVALSAASARFDLLTFADGGVDCLDGAWACVVDASASVSVGVPSLDTSAGMLVVAAAGAGLVGTPTFYRDAFGRDDLLGRLDDLVDSAEQTALGAETDLFVTQRGRYLGVVTTEGLAAPRVERSRTLALLAVPLDPAARIGVVLAPLGPRGTDAVADLEEGASGQTVRAALAEAGWVGEPDRSRGLPDPDVIFALEEELG